MSYCLTAEVSFKSGTRILVCNPVSNSYSASALTVSRGLNGSHSYSDYCCPCSFIFADLRLIELYFGQELQAPKRTFSAGSSTQCIRIWEARGR